MQSRTNFEFKKNWWLIMTSSRQLGPKLKWTTHYSVRCSDLVLMSKGLKTVKNLQDISAPIKTNQFKSFAAKRWSPIFTADNLKTRVTQKNLNTVTMQIARIYTNAKRRLFRSSLTFHRIILGKVLNILMNTNRGKAQRKEKKNGGESTK